MNFIQNARKWMAYRRTLDELANLSDDTLADIGIHRQDIRRVAHRVKR